MRHLAYVDHTGDEDKLTLLQIPEDLDIVFDPKYLLDIQFPQGFGKTVTVTAGIQLSQNGT